MQTLAQLDLPHLAVETPAFAADPMRYVAEAREKHPWIAASDLGYFIHEYSAIREFLGQEDKLRPAYDGIVEALGAHGTPTSSIAAFYCNGIAYNVDVVPGRIGAHQNGAP